jgi:hypothetical protein
MIGQAQQEDKFCKQIVHSSNAGEDISYFLDDDSTLYYGSLKENSKEKARMVVSTALIEQVIRQHHDLVFAGHQGIKRTQNFLTHYFWPTLSKVVEHYVQKCVSCATMKEAGLLQFPCENYQKLQSHCKRRQWIFTVRIRIDTYLCSWITSIAKLRPYQFQFKMRDLCESSCYSNIRKALLTPGTLIRSRY